MTKLGFHGPYRFLSNFWPAVVEYNSIVFPTVEHAYVAAKTKDQVLQRIISKLPTPGEARRLGKELIIRPEFNAEKYSIMEYLLRQKFEISHLKRLLLDTGHIELIEYSDTYWGICEGKGENNLGKLLMKIRGEAQSAQRKI